MLFLSKALSLIEGAINGNATPAGLGIDFLESVEKRLKRAHIHHKVLNLGERRYLRATIIARPKFKSPSFLRVIRRILLKVADYVKSFVEQAIEVGRPIADRMASTAFSWGNKGAIRWRNDPDFIFYWGLVGRDWKLDLRGGRRR